MMSNTETAHDKTQFSIVSRMRAMSLTGMSPELVEALKSFFENIGVVLVVLTAIFALGALIFTRESNRRQRLQLKQFDSDLTKAKTDLGRQQERAANAERSAAEAKTTAERAGEGTAKALEEQERLRNENLKLSIKLEEERTARLQLEARSETTEKKVGDVERAVVRRTLKITADSGSIQNQRRASAGAPDIYTFPVGVHTSFDSLKPFTGIKALIEYSPESEPDEAAGALWSVLSNAGWDVSVRSTPDVSNGVQIWWRMGSTDLRCEAAARVLEQYLKANESSGWSNVWEHPVVEQPIPINTLVIRIGVKQSPIK